MAEREKPRTRSTTPVTPEEYSTVSSSSFPSGDYTYVLEIVMRMQESMGRLTEAVGSLKEQSKAHGEKLDQVTKDVHAAKVVVGAVGGLIVIIGGIVAWLINTYISTHPPGK